MLLCDFKLVHVQVQPEKRQRARRNRRGQLTLVLKTCKNRMQPEDASESTHTSQEDGRARSYLLLKGVRVASEILENPRTLPSKASVVAIANNEAVEDCRDGWTSLRNTGKRKRLKLKRGHLASYAGGDIDLPRASEVGTQLSADGVPPQADPLSVPVSRAAVRTSFQPKPIFKLRNKLQQVSFRNS